MGAVESAIPKGPRPRPNPRQGSSDGQVRSGQACFSAEVHGGNRAAYAASEAAPPKSSHARVFEMTQQSQPCANGAEDHSDVLTSLTAPFEVARPRQGSLPVSASGTLCAGKGPARAGGPAA